MKAYIKEHLHIFILVAAVVVCALSFFATKKLIAVASENINKQENVLTDISTLQCIAYDQSENMYVYTGEPIETKISRFVFSDSDGNKLVIYADKFEIIEYINNVECGYADVKVSFEGYEGTLLLEDLFQIVPQQVQGLKITEASIEQVVLTWNETPGVQGYLLYKSKNHGKSFTPIKEIKVGEELTFQDKEIALNETYHYQVKAYVNLTNKTLFGAASEWVQQDTPLETAVLKSVSGSSYNSIKIQWNIVAGAVGYQVFRSESQNGTYTCIANVDGGASSSYTDSKCTLGTTYFYYVKACQLTGGNIVLGEASNVMNAKTNPNKVKLAGSTSENNTAVSLSWEKCGGAQGYELHKSTDGNNFAIVATFNNPDTLSWSESGMGDKEHAYYKVRSYAVVNGTTLYGLFSSVYSKQITIDYGQVATLTQYVGRPYVYGGTSPTNGWDCSAFVQYAYKKHFGISLPRSSGQQVAYGTTISKSNRSAWKPGDLIFYTMNGRVNHVAVYLGNNQIIHALNTKRDTFIIDVDVYEGWDDNTMYCVKRVLN